MAPGKYVVRQGGSRAGITPSQKEAGCALFLQKYRLRPFPPPLRHSANSRDCLSPLKKRILRFFLVPPPFRKKKANCASHTAIPRRGIPGAPPCEALRPTPPPPKVNQGNTIKGPNKGPDSGALSFWLMAKGLENNVKNRPLAGRKPHFQLIRPALQRVGGGGTGVTVRMCWG